MIYLDSAATSLYKPDSVKYAVAEAMTTMSSPGRGTHSPAIRAANVCYDCRENLARLFNVKEPEKIVFTLNATHALNIAISSVITKNMRVLTSGYEHNSVRRPLHASGAQIVQIATPLFDREGFLREFKEKINHCDAVVMLHVSNAFGYILPIEAVAKLCKEKGKPLIIDASQSAGILELDASRLSAEFIAMPGHKALLGPQGTGVLICKSSARPLLLGGSGSESASEKMPTFLPDMLEAGTHNVPGIAGLNEGVKYILKQKTHKIESTERELLDVMCEELYSPDKIKLFRADNVNAQCAVLSVLPKTMTCEAFAEALGRAEIPIRSGLHCAPMAHKTVGTFESGTARLSFSSFLSKEQVAQAARICKKILNNQ